MFAKTWIFDATSQLKMSVSPVSRTKGPASDTSAVAEDDAKVAIVTFCKITVAEAELSVILEYTTTTPVWLLYMFMFFTSAAVRAGQV
tara:strand:+ start:3200 stop:3463 length:264 start_codon:yes stop_codon:yes gene_type:complete